MIYVVSSENRRGFHHLLNEMHRQRKAVFIDRLHWRLAEIAGQEVDDYDAEDVIYLIEAANAKSGVVQSARLLPTDRPSLLSQHFGHLCDEAPPQGKRVWEATRFCPAPDTPSGPPRRAMLGRMIAAIMETALIFGVERVTYVADAALAPQARRAGWDVAPLGRPHGAGRARLQAFVAEIDAAGLRRVRTRFDIGQPLIRFVPANFATAA